MEADSNATLSARKAILIEDLDTIQRWRKVIVGGII